jgi:hypothetical protein
MKILLHDPVLEFDNNQFKQKLEDLSKQYSSITMNIYSFTDVLKVMSYDDEEYFTPITSRDVLKTGHYGTFNGMKIMVKRNVESGYAEIEKEEEDGK